MLSRGRRREIARRGTYSIKRVVRVGRPGHSHLPHLTATTVGGLCGGGWVLVSHLPPSLELSWEGIPGTGYMRLWREGR
jgi:hypothetical protein